MTSSCIVLTVDCIVRLADTGDIVLIERGRAPLGLALPGGKVEAGESAVAAVRREIREEVSIDTLHRLTQFRTYDEPGRDPRGRYVSIVYTAEAPAGVVLRAGDDAKAVRVFAPADIPWSELVFDHAKILRDYLISQDLIPVPDTVSLYPKLT